MTGRQLPSKTERFVRQVLGCVVGVACLAVFAPAANAIDIGLSYTSPPTAAVGQAGLQANFQLSVTGDAANGNVPAGTYFHSIPGHPGKYVGLCNTPNSSDNEGDAAPAIWPCTDTVIGSPWNHSFLLTPSCSQATGPTLDQPVCTGATDPGAIEYAATATGGGNDPSCIGTTFDVTPEPAVPGTVRIAPHDGTRLLLGDLGSTCTINLTFKVNRLPTDADPVAPGTQTRSIVLAGAEWNGSSLSNAASHNKPHALKAIAATQTTIAAPTCASLLAEGKTPAQANAILASLGIVDANPACHTVVITCASLLAGGNSPEQANAILAAQGIVDPNPACKPVPPTCNQLKNPPYNYTPQQILAALGVTVLPADCIVRTSTEVDAEMVGGASCTAQEIAAAQRRFDRQGLAINRKIKRPQGAVARPFFVDTQVTSVSDVKKVDFYVNGRRVRTVTRTSPDVVNGYRFAVDTRKYAPRSTYIYKKGAARVARNIIGIARSRLIRVTSRVTLTGEAHVVGFTSTVTSFPSSTLGETVLTKKLNRTSRNKQIAFRAVSACAAPAGPSG